MFYRFTDRARRVMVLANEEALREGEYIRGVHILLGMLAEGTGLGSTPCSGWVSIPRWSRNARGVSLIT